MSAYLTSGGNRSAADKNEKHGERIKFSKFDDLILWDNCGCGGIFGMEARVFKVEQIFVPPVGSSVSSGHIQVEQEVPGDDVENILAAPKLFL